MKINRGGDVPAKASDLADWQTRLRAALFEVVGEDDIREVMQALVLKAKAGDLAAMRLLFSYAFGGTTINVKNAVIAAGDGSAPLPTAPTKALPGTPEKFAELARRASQGRGLYSPRDAERDAS